MPQHLFFLLSISVLRCSRMDPAVFGFISSAEQQLLRIQRSYSCFPPRKPVSSRTVRYEFRVFVNFKRGHRGRPKVYPGPAAKVLWCDWARNCNGLNAICSFEQGITMVSLPSKVLWCDLVRNYNGLSAITSTHVRLSKELQWFRCRRKCPGAI